MAVEFAKFTPEEEKHVESIIIRTAAIKARGRFQYDEMTQRMDLSAVHAKTPLRLEEFARADDFNFAHDVSGIYRHMNRETGELDGHFLPRFAK